MDFFSGKVSPPFEADPREAFWTFSNFRDKVEGTSVDVVDGVITRAEQIEKRAFAAQKPFEKAACRSYAEDRTAAAQLLTSFSHGIYLSSLETMERIISDIADTE